MDISRREEGNGATGASDAAAEADREATTPASGCRKTISHLMLLESGCKYGSVI